MAGVDDIISKWVKQAERSSELQRGRYRGKPFNLRDGFEQKLNIVIEGLNRN